MSIIRRLAPLSMKVRLAILVAAAFALGSATVATAATAGIPVGSLFYIPLLNGVSTTPCNDTTVNGLTTRTCNAVVDSDGNLHVSSTGTSTINGSVSVNNFPSFPSDQAVHGHVTIDNPAAGDQAVHGHVTVDNPPADDQAVHGHVTVDNMPALPTDQLIHGTVTIANPPAATSGGVTVIDLPSENVASNGVAEWASIDISGCRAVSFAVAEDYANAPAPKVYAYAVLPPFSRYNSVPLSLIESPAVQWTYAFVTQPGANEPFFGSTIFLQAWNQAAGASNMSGKVYCAH